MRKDHVEVFISPSTGPAGFRKGGRVKAILGLGALMLVSAGGAWIGWRLFNQNSPANVALASTIQSPYGSILASSTSPLQTDTPADVASLANAALVKPKPEAPQGPPIPAPSKPSVEAPPSAAPIVAQSQALPAPPVIEIPADDQAEMMSRAAELIARGDIAGARVILSRLDRAGNGRATFALAQTFDPMMLSDWNVRGIRPDPDKAIEYYRRALDVGIGAARERLASLAPPQ